MFRLSTNQVILNIGGVCTDIEVVRSNSASRSVGGERRQITWSHHDAKAEFLFPEQTSHFVSTRVAQRTQAEQPKIRETSIDLTTLVPTTQSAGFNVRVQHIVE